MKRLTGVLGVIGALSSCKAIAPAAPSPSIVASPAPSGTRAYPHAYTPEALDGFSLVTLRPGVFAEPATTDEDRETLNRWSHEALAGLATFFGETKHEPPIIVFCENGSVRAPFWGMRRSRARMDPKPMVIINGFGPLTRGTIVHELVHVEIVRRMGKTPPTALPTWFDEGVASFVGDNAPCEAGGKRAIDDLRWLGTPRAWVGFTNMAGKGTAAYCQVREEIAAWVDRHGRQALVSVIDAVAQGQAFDDLYGPLVTSIPPEQFVRSLDARFPLDEDDGTNAADASGGSHIGSLISGAVWTTGHRGSAVKVRNGAYVRADDFTNFGIPDSPFSIALWVKPLVNAKVLVHTAMRASGGDGWCLPLLGYDATAHLVAQTNFSPDPKSFLVAVGPAPRLNAWSHVVVTWSASDGVRMYLNGALSASAPPRSSAERHRDATASPAYLFFGSDNGKSCWTGAIDAGSFNGAFDEIHVFNYALTLQQVLDDMRT